jgi:hypothetical protein
MGIEPDDEYQKELRRPMLGLDFDEIDEQI